MKLLIKISHKNQISESNFQTKIFKLLLFYKPAI